MRGRETRGERRDGGGHADNSSARRGVSLVPCDGKTTVSLARQRGAAKKAVKCFISLDVPTIEDALSASPVAGGG